MPTIAETFALAERAHRGQPDKAGKPYIDHPRAVAALLAPHGLEAVRAGLLHDVVEDTRVTYAQLHAEGYSDLVVTAVMSVTWAHKDETYDELIARAAAHPLGRHVKLADNTHNSLPGRLAALAATGEKGAKKAEVLRVKYATARATLLAAGATLWPSGLEVHSSAADPLPCPVLSETGLWCAKPIHPGWTPAEGHGGGHYWTTHWHSEIVRRGHYNATGVIAGEAVDAHLPEDCPGPDGCKGWVFLGRGERDEVLTRLGGAR